MPWKFAALACLALSLLLPVAPAEAARKHNTGHYIALMRGADTQAVMDKSMEPGVTGFMKRYTWRSLEPAQGRYDFSEIQSDLHWAASRGMRLVVMIEDKTFTAERPTPAYLDSLTVRNRSGGYTVLRWHPTVVTRMKALLQAMGRFDSNWAFEGVALQETSLGLDGPVLDRYGYSAAKYRDSYIEVLTTGANAMPTSRMFWFMNFLVRGQEQLQAVAEAVVSKGVVMGGPDVMPDNKALQKHAYPLYTRMKGRMPTFGQVEPICYAHEHETAGYRTKYWTMPELFRFARERMGVDYMFWVRVPNPPRQGAYDWTDALPVMRTTPNFGD